MFSLTCLQIYSAFGSLKCVQLLRGIYSTRNFSTKCNTYMPTVHHHVIHPNTHYVTVDERTSLICKPPVSQPASIVNIPFDTQVMVSSVPTIFQWGSMPARGRSRPQRPIAGVGSWEGDAHLPTGQGLADRCKLRQRRSINLTVLFFLSTPLKALEVAFDPTNAVLYRTSPWYAIGHIH